MRSYAASGWDVLRKVRVPNAVPFLFTALRIAAPLSVIYAYVSEYFGGAQNGLGSRIASNYRQLEERRRLGLRGRRLPARSRRSILTPICGDRPPRLAARHNAIETAHDTLAAQACRNPSERGGDNNEETTNQGSDRRRWWRCRSWPQRAVLTTTHRRTRPRQLTTDAAPEESTAPVATDAPAATDATGATDAPAATDGECADADTREAAAAVGHAGAVRRLLRRHRSGLLRGDSAST